MKIKAVVLGALLALALLLTMAAMAKTGSGKAKDKDKDRDSPAATAGTHNAQDDTMRLAGEKRFHSNCARCHVSPPKFSPRMMGTIVRHMRVRSAITEEDARLILHYMSQ